MQHAVHMHMILVQIKVINYITRAISSSLATFSNLTIGGTRVGMNKYSGYTGSSSVGSNLSSWNVNRSTAIVGNSPAIRRQQLEMSGQRISRTTRKVMIDGRLVAEISAQIIPNGNTSNINIRGTGIGTTTTTDNSYFMDSNLYGAKDGYYPIYESILKTSIVPLCGAAEVDLTPVKAQIDPEREQ